MLRFLSIEEMEGLTGLKRPAAQRKWLTDQGFPYAEGGDGQPKVLEEVVLQRLVTAALRCALAPRRQIRARTEPLARPGDQHRTGISDVVERGGKFVSELNRGGVQAACPQIPPGQVEGHRSTGQNARSSRGKRRPGAGRF